MKIAAVTAVFGGKDHVKPFAEQSIPCDHYCFTEENSPVPLPNLPDRLKAKYFKLQAHRVLPEYGAYVWIDGNIEVKHPDFVARMIEAAGQGIAIQKHHERQTIQEEIDFILASENPYLTTRYREQPLRQEYRYYLAQGMPPDTPLYACNLFAWSRDSGYIDPFFNEWWSLVLEWSYFDQSAFSYLAWKYRHSYAIVPVHTPDLGGMFSSPHFTLHPHAKALG